MPLKHITVEQGYELADWAVRAAAPALLSYSDGKRKCFPEYAEQLSKLFPIKTESDARSAIQTLTKDVIPKVSQYRDGMVGVILRQAHWLCMAAIQIDKGNAIPTDYGSRGIRDVAEYLRIPINV